MKRLLLVLAALLPLIASAETKEQRLESRHEIRIGVGDPIIARAWIGSGAGWTGASNYDLWARTFGQNVTDAHSILQDGRVAEQRGKSHMLGHIFLEYQYRINPYIGVGLKTDMIHFWRDWDIYNGYHDRVGTATSGEFYMDVVPMARFTFLHKEYVNLYAAAGIGFSMSCDYNYPLSADDVWLKAEATLFGVSIGKNGFFGAVEILNIGCSFGNMSGNYFFTFPLFYSTQFFTASIGYRF